jgi:uncharacterized protein (TIGR03437 family)
MLAEGTPTTMETETTGADRAATSRANGAKSHGPTSIPGKRNSRRNALTHGQTARLLTLDRESDDSFIEVLAALEAQLQPQNELEDELVETIAYNRWRTVRTWSQEKAVLDTAMSHANLAAPDLPTAECGGIALRNLSDQSRVLAIIDRNENRYQRSYHRALRELFTLRDRDEKAQTNPASPTKQSPPEKTNPAPSEPVSADSASPRDNDLEQTDHSPQTSIHPVKSNLTLLFLLTAVAHAQTPFAVDDFENHTSRTTLRPNAAAATQCATTGPQNIAVLAVTTPANPTLAAAWNNSAMQQAWFAPTGLSLNTYWQDASYGQTSATGQVFGPFALTQNYDCGNLDALAAAAITAASSSLNVSQYNRFAIVFPTQSCSSPDLGSIGGYGSIGCYVPAPLNQNASVAWFPILPKWAAPANSVGILAHEHGHNLGLNHSNTESYANVPLAAPDAISTNTEYGDPYSVMGNADIRSTLPTLGQYTGEHKALTLNWLNATEVQTSGTYTLAPFESTSGTRALRILRDPVEGSWLWAEYRQPIGIVDTTLSHLSATPFTGLLIHYEDPLLDALHTYLLDFQPNTVLTSGQTWSDPYSPLTLTATAANSLTATYDPTCAALTQSSNVITVTAPPTCQWTATTATPWLTLSTRNNTVTYIAAANPDTSQRLGFITINRQTLPVIQPGRGVSINGITPAVLNGTSGKISIQFSGSPNAIYVRFSGPETCAVNIYPTQAVPFNPVPNSGICSMDPTQSVITGQGSLTLAMTFSATTFAGSHHITAIASGGPETATLTLGTWTVGGSTLASISPASVVIGSGVFTITATGINFVAGQMIQWNGTALPTTFVSTTQLTATVPANLIASATVTVSGATGSQPFTVTAPPPVITPGGIVPVGSTISTIAPGEWISVYGSNLSQTTAEWNGEYPTTLGGASVLIDGRPAYLSYVSPTQINAQVPDDSKTGVVSVQVGTATSTVTLATFAPSWIPLDATHAVAINPITPGLIAAGQIIELFGVGFGPTSPTVPAGHSYSGAANTTNPVTVTIGGINAKVQFAGIIIGGLYQINVEVPQLPPGDQLLKATVGAVSTPQGVNLTLQ